MTSEVTLYKMKKDENVHRYAVEKDREREIERERKRERNRVCDKRQRKERNMKCKM